MPKVSVNFLDVGQGDGTVITSSLGEIVLIDMGSKKNAQIAGVDALVTVSAIIYASMMHRQSKQAILNRLLITHGDGDHYNLLPTLVRAITSAFGSLQIDEVAIGGSENDYADKDLWDTVLTPAKNAGKLTLFGNKEHDIMDDNGVVATPRWTLANGAAKLYLLSANYEYQAAGPKNQKSLVVMLEYANCKVILTGDAEEPAENAIRGYYAKNLGFLQSFALKLGHHGSQAGSSVEWLKVVKQQASFASSDMKYAHPYCVTIKRIQDTIGNGLALYKHPWICGQGSGENKVYTNYNNEMGFYSNMASMDQRGLVRGVQYQLDINDDGTVQLIHTSFGAQTQTINLTDTIVSRHADAAEVPARPSTGGAAPMTPAGCCG